MSSEHIAPRSRAAIATACSAALAALGCASLPEPSPQRALYVDVRKGVELSEDTGWTIDRLELEENLEHAMRSACQVEPAVREGLSDWLTGQIARSGGAAEARYRAGAELGDLSEALTLERTRALLRLASTRSAEDCPFWLEPDPEFAGVHGDAQRFVMLAETLGHGSVVLEEREMALGGGGGGRLFFGHGLDARLTLAVGGEVGAVGSFVPTEDGGRSIETTFIAALPVLLRFTHFSRIFDVELAPVTRVVSDQSALPPGVRASFGAGFSAMRSSAFMPYALLWVGYEFHPKDRHGPADHAAHIGTRVGVDWDP